MLRRLGRGGDVLPLRLLEVRGQKELALAPGLRVRVEFLDVLDGLAWLDARFARRGGGLRGCYGARPIWGGVRVFEVEVAEGEVGFG